MANVRVSFSCLTMAGVFCLVLGQSALATGASDLSAAQASVVARQIARLKSAPERTMASSWPAAKQVAEFICRPLAMSTLKRRFRGADRVFLGTDDPATLSLVNNSRLDGSGQVRTGNSWQTFRFSCALNPRSGRAVSFNVIPTATAAAPAADPAAPRPWLRHFGPGPVRSPTFNPSNWPGSKPGGN